MTREIRMAIAPWMATAASIKPPNLAYGNRASSQLTIASRRSWSCVAPSQAIITEAGMSAWPLTFWNMPTGQEAPGIRAS